MDEKWINLTHQRQSSNRNSEILWGNQRKEDQGVPVGQKSHGIYSFNFYARGIIHIGHLQKGGINDECNANLYDQLNNDLRTKRSYPAQNGLFRQNKKRVLFCVIVTNI